MKHTDFRFELRITGNDHQTALGGLKTKLRTIEGINSVTAIESDCIVALALNASFEDSEQAKKLHRQVMNSIMAYDGVEILQVATVLTDIF